MARSLLLAYFTVVGAIATWHLCREVISLRVVDIAWSWARPTTDRIHVVLREQHATDPDAAFDAYELIRQHTNPWDKVYFFRDFDLQSVVTFYRLMSLSYPRELFPIRRLGKDWVPPEHRSGQRIFVLDYSSVLANDPRLNTVARRGSCSILAYKDTE